jgi:hypothetical protein
MSKPTKPVFSNDVIALARDELKYHRRGDAYQCAIMRSRGRDFVLARASVSNTDKRGRMFAIGEDGEIFPALLLDGLYSVDEPIAAIHYLDD